MYVESVYDSMTDDDLSYVEEQYWPEHVEDTNVVSKFNEDNIYVDYEDDYSDCNESGYMSTLSHAKQAENTLKKLKATVKEKGWKKESIHRSGVTVYSKNKHEMPIYMGVHVINGFHPQAVFAVVGMRKLWDDWYEEGNLVENINDTTSLTYMVLQGLSGSKPRDLSLVEKIECARDGAIYFAAKSVQTERIPKVTGRVRAYLKLSGWILEPLSVNPPRTKVTYLLQTKIKGWIPLFLANKYLLRRPLVMHTIDVYLQKNGPPPMLISSLPSGSQTSSFSMNGLPTPSSSTSSVGSSFFGSNGSNGKFENSEGRYKGSNKRKISFARNNYSINANLMNGSSAAFKPTNVNKFDNVNNINGDDNHAVSTTIESHVKPSSQKGLLTKPNNNQGHSNRYGLNLKHLTPLPKQSIDSDASSNTRDFSEHKDAFYLPRNDSSYKQEEKDDDDRKEDTDDYDYDDDDEIISEEHKKEIKNQLKDAVTSSSPNKKHERKSKKSKNQIKVKKSSSTSRRKHHRKSASKTTESHPTILRNKQSHVHSDALKEAFGKFKSESSSLEGWTFHSESKGLKIYMKDVPGKSTPIMRGDMIITGDYTAEDLCATVCNLNMTKIWDDQCDGGEVIELLNDYDCLCRLAMKGIFPISGRDMSLVSTVDREEATGTLRYVTTSVVDPSIPHHKKYVRADINFAGWEFVPTFLDSYSNSTNNNMVKSFLCKHIVDIDIKLDIVPSFILRQLSIQTPMAVLKVDDTLRKIGHPPYLLLESSSTSLVTPENLNTKNFEYVTTIKSFPNAVAEIKFSKLMYPNGFDVSFEPYGNGDNIKVELLAVDSEVVRVTVTSSLSSDKLKIKIKKNFDDKGYELTYSNGVKNIPVAAKEKIPNKRKGKGDDNKISELPPKESTDNNNNSKNDVIGSIDKHFYGDLDNNKTLVPRNIDIINMLRYDNDDNDGDDDDEDDDDYYDYDDYKDNGRNNRNRKSVTLSVSRVSFSEQTFIKQKIDDESLLKSATVAAAGFENKLIRVDNTKRTNSLIVYNSGIGDNTEKSIVNIKTSSSAVISSNINDNNVIANVDKTESNNDIAKMVAEFNSQQLIMMILSMAMSYYAGKLSTFQQ